MVQQAERLSRLVDQLLDLSKLESGDVPLQLEAVDVRSLVRRIGPEIEMARTGRGVHLEEEIAQGLPPVRADRERLHQVLFNLLDNAYRFSPQGGVVTVRAERSNGSCEISVEDGGPGIPAEHLPLVFERFYRVDQSRSRDDGGTGIGLAIARSIVEAHGGRIWAENGPVGARFRFVIPIADRVSTLGASPANRVRSHREPAPVGGTREEA